MYVTDTGARHYAPKIYSLLSLALKILLNDYMSAILDAYKMLASDAADLRSRYLNRYVTGRDPRAALLSERYRNAVSSKSLELNSRDLSSFAFEKTGNAAYSSLPTFSNGNYYSETYPFPKNYSGTQNAMAHAAIYFFASLNEMQRLVYELAKIAKTCKIH